MKNDEHGLELLVGTEVHVTVLNLLCDGDVYDGYDEEVGGDDSEHYLTL